MLQLLKTAQLCFCTPAHNTIRKHLKGMGPHLASALLTRTADRRHPTLFPWCSCNCCCCSSHVLFAAASCCLPQTLIFTTQTTAPCHSTRPHSTSKQAPLGTNRQCNTRMLQLLPTGQPPSVQPHIARSNNTGTNPTPLVATWALPQTCQQAHCHLCSPHSHDMSLSPGPLHRPLHSVNHHPSQHSSPV